MKKYRLAKLRVHWYTLPYRFRWARVGFRYPWQLSDTVADPVVKRVFRMDGADKRIMEHHRSGRITPTQADFSQLDSALNKAKNSMGDSELTDRLKKQGQKIGELTKKLKEHGIT